MWHASRMSPANMKLMPVVVALGLLTACNEKKAATPVAERSPIAAAAPAAPTADDKAAALELFNNRCTPCHGPQGHGDGPASAALTPRPRNFSEADWQKSVTDEHLEKIIVYGGAAVGKSPAMPANPDLDQKPGVVKELRAHIRTLKAAP